MLPQFFREHGWHSFASGKIFFTGVSDPPSWDTDIAEVIVTPAKAQTVERGGVGRKAQQRKSFEWTNTSLTADELPDHKVALDVVRLIEEARASGKSRPRANSPPC